MLSLPTTSELRESWRYLTPREREEIQAHLETLAGFAPALLPDPVEWIETNFYIPETNGPIKLYPYQQRCLREALSVGGDGLFKYSVIVWSDIKKSAKSTLAAAVALFMAYHRKWGQVVSVANDLKQADSRVAYYARRAIELNPKMRAECKIRNYKITFPNGTFFEAVPIDPTGEAGGNADMVIFSEAWGSSSKAQQSMWCYDDKTEILTRGGWKKGTDLTVGDIVATVTPYTHIMEWEKVNDVYHGHYQGEMHLYESKTFSECVTPNHRLYGKFSRGGRHTPGITGVIRSDDLRSVDGYAVYYPLTSLNGYMPDAPTGSVVLAATKFKLSYSIEWGDFCEYLGWYLSEGRVKCNGIRPVSVIVSQCPKANPGKWKQLKQLHERIFSGVGWRLSHDDTSFR
jgi:hypothetical protein